jgi:hypothetical protein
MLKETPIPKTAAAPDQTMPQFPPDLLERLGPDLSGILLDPSLTNRERLEKLRPHHSRLNAEIAGMRRKVAANHREADRLKALVDEFQAFPQWVAQPAVLQKNDCSRLHLLAAAMAVSDVAIDNGVPLIANGEDEWRPDRLSGYQAFVVQHDWGRAFAGAQDFAVGGAKLPFNQCAFEFRISDRTVVVLARQDEGGPIHCLPFVQLTKCWTIGGTDILLENDPTEGFYRLALQQVRAVCIALDAEVASHDLIRAPHKLNAKREREGKLPLFDYRVVSLSRRARAQELPRSAYGLSPTRKRLHFRRGHWRHYAESKTWVRWTLVGDPALGWIDHEYRL